MTDTIDNHILVDVDQKAVDEPVRAQFVEEGLPERLQYRPVRPINATTVGLGAHYITEGKNGKPVV